MKKKQDQNKGKPTCSFRKLSLPDNPWVFFFFLRGYIFGSITEMLSILQHSTGYHFVS